MRSLFGAPVTLHGLTRYTAASAADGVAAMSSRAVFAAAAAIKNSEHNTINYYMKMKTTGLLIFM